MGIFQGPICLLSMPMGPHPKFPILLWDLVVWLPWLFLKKIGRKICRKRKPNNNIDYLRPYEKLIPKGERKGSYKYPKGTTSVLSTNTYQIEDVQVRSIPMET